MVSTSKTKNGPCPSYFKGWVRTAQTDHRYGYKMVGRQLIKMVAGFQLCPYEVEQDEWDASVEGLNAHITHRDDAEVLGWFDEMLPRMMALIPRARRQAFLDGIYEVAINEGYDITSY